jgi:SAM-dependent methyltransferase
MTDKDFWENRWQKGETGWDLHGVSPAIKKYIDTLADKTLRILIPGCGNAYEAEYLLQQGFTHITVIDIAPSLTDALINKNKAAVEAGTLTVICGDFFAHQGQYDVIIEQTFFCAISPTLREAYAQHMNKLLAPKGKLVGLLFNTAFAGGPPFGGDIEEYFDYFEKHFGQVSMEPCEDSIAPRAGKEVWITIGH